MSFSHTRWPNPIRMETYAFWIEKLPINLDRCAACSSSGESIIDPSSQSTDGHHGTHRKSLAGESPHEPSGPHVGRLVRRGSRLDHCVPEKEKGKPETALGAFRRDAVARQPVRVGRGNSGTGVDPARPLLHEDDLRRRSRPRGARAARPRHAGTGQPGSITPICVAITAA